MDCANGDGYRSPTRICSFAVRTESLSIKPSVQNSANGAMETWQASESFSRRLLLHRGRTGLTQRDLAARAGIGLRSIQDWEGGVTLPTAERLQTLLRALLEGGGLT